MEWISFKDKLPEHGDKVLVLTKNSSVLGATAFIVGSAEKPTGYYAVCQCEASVPIKQLSHWMPLPTLPQ